MKRVVVVGLALISVAAFAQNVQESTSEDPNRRICRRMKETGTRLGNVRVCKTAAEWDREERAIREAISNSQTRGRTTSGQ
jgi:Flp pilus assembly protein TadB